MPAKLDEINRRVMQLEIEREALKKEGLKGTAREAGKRARRSHGSAHDLMARAMLGYTRLVLHYLTNLAPERV
jgi:hypothetical protein